MVIVANLGFPRMGANRELKKCIEKFWAHTVSEAELLETTKVNCIFSFPSPNPIRMPLIRTKL